MVFCWLTRDGALDILGRVCDYLWMTEITTSSAADQLGVSQRQVQRLIASGELPASRTAGDAWVVDALTLNALARDRPSRGRPWTPAVAWAALWQLSGLHPDWLDRRSASRLSERLTKLGGEGVLHACRRRAAVHRYRVSDSFVDELNTAVVLTGTSAMDAGVFGMSRDATRVDGYCDETALADLAVRFHLAEDHRGNATLRVAPMRALPIGDRDEMPLAVVAADLAESIEARERSAGLRVLGNLLP